MSELTETIDRFIEAVTAEIETLERESRDWKFALESGRSTEAGSASGARSFVFAMSDPQRLPEDAAGTLTVQGASFLATVVAQEGNQIWIWVEDAESLPNVISSAVLHQSQTELLERLKRRLEEVSADGWGPVANALFGSRKANTSWKELDGAASNQLGKATAHALEQALGSDITYLWGPPGTGKTYTIAALVAASLEAGDRVLVTSHTHAAVEQALWAAIEPPDVANGRDAGPLNGSGLVEAGRVLKVGPLRQSKIPRECHLDAIVEDRAAEVAHIKQTLQLDRVKVGSPLAEARKQLDEWKHLDDLQRSRDTAWQEVKELNVEADHARQRSAQGERALSAARQSLSRAESSLFIRKKRRLERAQYELRTAMRLVEDAETEVAAAADRFGESERNAHGLESRLAERRTELVGGPDRHEVEAAIADLSASVKKIDDQVADLDAELDGLGNRLLREAQAVFMTLTKLYVDSRAEDLRWDTVILDEASMALPPLVALAARQASKRIVLSGDFYQLPPIVHSRDGIAATELGSDVFERAGIPAAVEAGEDHPQLASLRTQRRMNPQIADVARNLVYGDHLDDYPGIEETRRPLAIGVPALESPLSIVDISDLHSWSGRDKGTLSRFNFHSALASVEVAALFAAAIDQPDVGQGLPIGIITPYASQRRFLARLVEDLGLGPWVAVGTVHTFQGNECDVIIFDTVLAEPSWGARLTNPNAWEEVKRDINVAVTRARRQLVLVGDAVWLEKRAREGSGFGNLWREMKAGATSVSALDLLGTDFRTRLMGSGFGSGWSAKAAPRDALLLDERSFYQNLFRDLGSARNEVVLFAPFIGKTRWPQVEPAVMDLASRGVEVFFFHKPLNDEAWVKGDPAFGRHVLGGLEAAGVHLVPIQGVHAKTIVVDRELVYDGSLNWASQTDSYEHIWRWKSRELAQLVYKKLQLEQILPEYASGPSQCPNCAGPVVVLNQRDKGAYFSKQPLAFTCANHLSEDHDTRCELGHIRGVHVRAPLLSPPTCSQGETMALRNNKNGQPWKWVCSHRSCQQPRWLKGDVIPGGP